MTRLDKILGLVQSDAEVRKDFVELLLGYRCPGGYKVLGEPHVTRYGDGCKRNGSCRACWESEITEE